MRYPQAASSDSKPLLQALDSDQMAQEHVAQEDVKVPGSTAAADIR